VAESEGFEPPIPVKVCRFSSSQAGSDPFGKFSTLFDFSTGYNRDVLIRSAPKCSVLSMELLQFYYSSFTTVGMPWGEWEVQACDNACYDNVNQRGWLVPFYEFVLFCDHF
jgi:hypothetical protein